MATEGEGYTDYNGDTGEWDQLDVHVDQEWERAQKAKSPQFALQTRLENETTEDRLERYTAILPTLDPKHQEVAELWMNGHTENQIAEQLEMSPQKVVRTKVKIRGAMAAGAAINSGKGVVA
jgi:DNA-binding NarL/FixJ family response regulator